MTTSADTQWMALQLGRHTHHHERIPLMRIDPDDILRAASDSLFGTEDNGFCLSCGEEQMGVEPDAEAYECDCCGQPTVYGAEQLLLLGHTG